MNKRVVKENLLAIGVSLILSFVVFLAIQNSSYLMADIASTQAVFGDDSDLVSYVEWDQLYVVATKPLPRAVSLSMLLFYDPETVKIEQWSLTSDFDLSYAPAGPWRGSVSIQGNLSQLAKWDKIVTFDLLGEPRDMAISDLVITFADGTTDRLSLAIK